MPLLIIGVVVAIVLVVLVLAAMAISIYNRLVSLNVGYKNAFAQIDVQLRRRYDLIPNLVEVAKGYMAHERQTLEAVIAARNQAAAAVKAAAATPGEPGALASLASAEAGLGGALGRLFVVAEQYPELKANANMMQLTEELTSTENKISFARQAYNDSVMQFNGYRRSFPPVIFAPMFGFATDAATLELGDAAVLGEAPKVRF